MNNCILSQLSKTRYTKFTATGLNIRKSGVAKFNHRLFHRICDEARYSTTTDARNSKFMKGVACNQTRALRENRSIDSVRTGRLVTIAREVPAVTGMLFPVGNFLGSLLISPLQKCSRIQYRLRGNSKLPKEG